MAKGGKVPFHDLFKNADTTDVVLMLVGIVGALASGMSQVVMAIIFGQMVDAFGGATPGTILPRVNKVPFCSCMNLLACNTTETCYRFVADRLQDNDMKFHIGLNPQRDFLFVCHALIYKPKHHSFFFIWQYQKNSDFVIWLTCFFQVVLEFVYLAVGTLPACFLRKY